MPPDEMSINDLQPKLESVTNCVESDVDPRLHASYVDHDGNVVFVDYGDYFVDLDFYDGNTLD